MRTDNVKVSAQTAPSLQLKKSFNARVIITATNSKDCLNDVKLYKLQTWFQQILKPWLPQCWNSRWEANQMKTILLSDSELHTHKWLVNILHENIESNSCILHQYPGFQGFPVVSFLTWQAMHWVLGRKIKTSSNSGQLTDRAAPIRFKYGQNLLLVPGWRNHDNTRWLVDSIITQATYLTAVNCMEVRLSTTIYQRISLPLHKKPLGAGYNIRWNDRKQ